MIGGEGEGRRGTSLLSMEADDFVIETFLMLALSLMIDCFILSNIFIALVFGNF